METRAFRRPRTAWTEAVTHCSLVHKQSAATEPEHSHAGKHSDACQWKTAAVPVRIDVAAELNSTPPCMRSSSAVQRMFTRKARLDKHRRSPQSCCHVRGPFARQHVPRYVVAPLAKALLLPRRGNEEMANEKEKGAAMHTVTQRLM